MTSRADIITEARRWVGTPFKHQGRRRGRAVDCAGLIIGTGLATGAIDGYKEIGYGRQPNPERMGGHLNQWMELIPVSEARDGDVYWFRFIQPMHVGFASTLPDGRAGVIHAWQDIGRCVEHGLDDTWRRRIVAAFRFHGVTD